MSKDQVSRLNLSAVQKVDTFCKEIIDSSASCALYQFDQTKNSWEKLEFEGVFHLCKRSLVPFHCFVIINIKNKENWKQLITRSTKIQIQAPFVLYKTTDDNTGGLVQVGTNALKPGMDNKIYGLWFSDQKDCQRVASRLASIIKELGPGSSSSSSSKSLVSAQPDVVQRTAPQRIPSSKASAFHVPVKLSDCNSGSVDILQMLTTAQDKFQKQQQQQPTPTAIASASRQPISVENLFQAVSGQRRTIENSGSTGVTPDTKQPLADMQDATELLKRMMGVNLGGGGGGAEVVVEEDIVDGEEMLMTPAQVLGSGDGSGSDIAAGGPPLQVHQEMDNRALSKEQLKEALVEMLQEEKFVDSLHAAYIRSLQRKFHL